MLIALFRIQINIITWYSLPTNNFELVLGNHLYETVKSTVSMAPFLSANLLFDHGFRTIGKIHNFRMYRLPFLIPLNLKYRWKAKVIRSGLLVGEAS